MKTPDILSSLVEMVEEAYRTDCHADSSDVVKPCFVRACMALSNIGFQQRDRYMQLTAMGLASWSESERDDFYQQYEVRYAIMQLANDPPASWPQPQAEENEEEPEEEPAE